MKLASVICLVSILSLTGCGGPWIMAKSELKTWYRDELSQYSGAGKLGYKGSDIEFHYFLARPVDAFVVIQVPKADLKLKDERSTSELGRDRLYFYLVDPVHEFRKIEGAARKGIVIN